MATLVPCIDADGHIVEREADIRLHLRSPWDRRSGPLVPADQPWDQFMSGTRGYGSRDYQPLPGIHYTRGMSPEAQIEAWHAIMERSGIEHAICFPTSSSSLTKTRERDWQLAVAAACNDHFAKDFNARSNRVHCVGLLPAAYPAEAAEELRRAHSELGITAFVIPTAGLPCALGDVFYDPIYREAERLGVAVCCHAMRTWSHELGADQLSTFNEVHTYAMTAGLLLHFTSIIFQGVPVRFPKLRLAFLEIGATWLPYYLDRMNEHWEKRGKLEAPLLERKPSEIVRRSNVYFSVEEGESQLKQTIDYLGSQHFVYASDIPHWDNEFPVSLEHLRSHPDLSDEVKHAVLYANAAALYKLKVPASLAA